MVFHPFRVKIACLEGCCDITHDFKELEEAQAFAMAFDKHEDFVLRIVKRKSDDTEELLQWKL